MKWGTHKRIHKTCFLNFMKVSKILILKSFNRKSYVHIKDFSKSNVLEYEKYSLNSYSDKCAF